MNNPTKPNLSKLKIAGVFLASAIAIGAITIMILKFANTPKLGDQPETSQSKPVEVTAASALAKLEAGDKEGGLADLQTALATAKKRNDTATIQYIEQQIDFAKNSNFNKPDTAPPVAESPDSNEPGRVTR